MTSTMKYKGYTGRVEFDAEDNLLFGEVIGLRDIITFQGTTVEEIVKAFHKSVDTYLDFCKEQEQEPEKPFAGKIPFRTTPEIHYRIYMAAKLANKSINAWMNEVLAEIAQRAMAASKENDVALPTATQAAVKGLKALVEMPYSYALAGDTTGQKDKEEVSASSWPDVMPIRLIDPETIGQLVAEEATQKVAQEETPLSEEKLHELVADATQTAIEGIKPGTLVSGIPTYATMNSTPIRFNTYYVAGSLPEIPEIKEAEGGRRRIRKSRDTEGLRPRRKDE
jgi:predicted HicB family RNase H-like nuclease/tetrahydromethanopterin S-methyltransferase subunit B